MSDRAWQLERHYERESKRIDRDRQNGSLENGTCKRPPETREKPTWRTRRLRSVTTGAGDACRLSRLDDDR